MHVHLFFYDVHMAESPNCQLLCHFLDTSFVVTQKGLVDRRRWWLAWPLPPRWVLGSIPPFRVLFQRMHLACLCFLVPSLVHLDLITGHIHFVHGNVCFLDVLSAFCRSSLEGVFYFIFFQLNFLSVKILFLIVIIKTARSLVQRRDSPCK